MHVHYAIPHAVAALLAKDIIRPHRLPVVTTLHGTDITIVGQDPAYERVTTYALQGSDSVTAVSEYLRLETTRLFAVDRPIHVIPNFVDSTRFKPNGSPAVQTCFSPRGEAVLVHMSNFRPVKRAVKAIEAFAKVRESRQACLLMVGDGPERAACESRARDLGLRQSVRFLGAQADVERILPSADVLLLPSEYESFGLAALEAMACGVVPVVTHAGGLPEVVRDGVDGVLVPADDIDHMGARVCELLDDGDRLAAMKEAARRTAVEEFGLEKIVPEYEALYTQVLETG